MNVNIRILQRMYTIWIILLRIKFAHLESVIMFSNANLLVSSAQIDS